MSPDLFEVLKFTLKARRMTYASLAARLHLSEPTVKRIFAERDCKMSRLDEICAVLGLTLEDLVAEAARIEVQPTDLSRQVEARLADDRPAFHLFLLLLDGMTADTVQAHYALSDTALFDIARRLETLGLVDVLPGGALRLRVQAPVRFRRDGPLHRGLMDLNMAFLRATFLRPDGPQSAFGTQTRQVSGATARHMVSRLRDLEAELSDLARRDQLTHAPDALHTYKLTTAWAPISFVDLLALDTP
ncbi:transcriptional regulator [Jannaschia pagri]|uniref:Transcriptional regulator n=1 Tax=Jannaschia pagri TaxID=2829797 RepID=A0ABQ4NHR8_9RHOB|nr:MULTISPECIES: helix-turn-helix transcriptional regulator [unclassified Jannaschia]GIT89939.1 transcriptional regulator [Jannaschia sp. AI_61]GIT93954.1 transcriptional regulator [Jannaschia sp. AI_62]